MPKRTSASDSVGAKLTDLLEKDTPACTAPHVIVEARAGTGKTTTLVEGLKFVTGGTSSLTPSEQQRAVWDELAKSAGKVKSVGFVAFNKAIAEELQRRVPAGVSAMTMHSLGLKAVTAAFGRCNVSSYRVLDVIAELCERDLRDLRKDRPVLVLATEKIVGLCKMNLLEGTPEDVAEIAAEYDIDLNGSAADVTALVPRVLDRCRDVMRDKRIDFNDMIWLPAVLNLPVQRFDLLLVDEAQDLNRCQQKLAKAAGNRLVFCGDPKQAIYGFAGADSKSMQRLLDDLADTLSGGEGRGCVVLPLTVTRRCGKAIVREANKIVPDFTAFETNPEGRVERASLKVGSPTDYRLRATDGDMVLCRCNAPLVSECFRFLKAGKKATIRGRDIGAGLISTVTKMKAGTVTELVGKLETWLSSERAKENAKKNPSEARLIGLEDRFDCLIAFTDGVPASAPPQVVVDRINAVFTDEPGKGIQLSSIHKAKGLEAETVYLLEPERATVPHPMAKTPSDMESEWNLRYVAVTRAIHCLVFVS